MAEKALTTLKCGDTAKNAITNNVYYISRQTARIGLDLGGPTPKEIAMAILAEVIAVRRGGKASVRSR